MRKSHKLRDNKKTEIPNHIIFFDTETIREDNVEKLFLGWCVYTRKGVKKEDWFYFEKAKDFWDFVETKTKDKIKVWLVAHNIVFDFFVLCGVKELRRRGWKLIKLYENSDMFFAMYRKNKKTIVLLDSFNYFKNPLKDLGEAIGIKKLEIDFENTTKEYLSLYCKNDVLILKEFFWKFLTFWEENNLGTFGKTIAACAFNVYRHKFLHDIYIHNNQNVTNLEIESYRGGRTECFRFGELSNIYVLDVNSMYPFVMKNKKYPKKLIAYFKTLTLEQLEKYLEKYCVIAKVKIETSKPIFGLKDKKRGLVFPVGVFLITLTTEELKYALSHNLILEVYDTAIYEAGYIFKEFIEFFWRKRKEAKENKQDVYYLFYKTIMNSLYGKFAQKSEIWEKINSEYDDGIYYYLDADTGKRTLIRSINGKVERKKGSKLSYNSFVAISSEVTANARMYLFELIEKAGFENVVYCDTDSLFVNAKGFQNLSNLLGNELGQLKLEKQYIKLHIRGLKDYKGIALDNSIVEKIKGIRKDAKQIEENVFEQLQFCKFRTLMRRQVFDGVIVEVRSELCGI